MQLTDPVNVRLPVETYERVKEESERTAIPVGLLIRRCVVETYGGVSRVSKDYTNNAVTTESMQQQGDGNAGT